MDKYVNATKMIEKIDEALGMLKDKDGNLPDCIDVRELLYCRKMIDLAPGALDEDYVLRFATPVTIDWKAAGLLKSVHYGNVEILIHGAYCGFETKNGYIVSVELLREPVVKQNDKT